jgi:WD40 repeat protein
VELAAVVGKMMAKEPERRFQEPRELAQALTPYFRRGLAPYPPPQPSISSGSGPSAGAKVAEAASPPIEPGAAGGQEPDGARSPGRLLPARGPRTIVQTPAGLGRAEQDGPEAPAVGAAARRKTPWKWPSLAAAVGFGLLALGWAAGVLIPPVATTQPPIAPPDRNLRAAPADSLQTLSRSDRLPWTSLFNGRDLTGWKTHPSQPGNWRVENGTLIGSGPATSHLYSDRGDYKDFHLRALARFTDGGRGGVFARASFGPLEPAKAPEEPSGLEALINSMHLDRDGTGSLAATAVSTDLVWSSPERNAPRIFPGQWFRIEFILDRKITAVMVNGQIRAYHYGLDGRVRPGRRGMDSPGHIALQQLAARGAIELRSIEIRELHTGEPADPRQIRCFIGHEGRLTRVAFAPNERTILSGCDSGERAIRDGDPDVPGRDHTARLWDVETGSTVHILKGHGPRLRALAYSGDGRLVAASSLRGGFRHILALVWDTRTGQELHALPRTSTPARGTVEALAFSSDTRRLLIARSGGTIQVWDLDSEKEQTAVTLHDGSSRPGMYTTMALVPGGRQVLTGRHSGAVSLWDLQSGRCSFSSPGLGGEARDLACSAGGLRVLSAGSDDIVRLWDGGSQKMLRSFRGDERELRAVAISPDGRRALSGGNDGIVRLWDLESGREVCQLPGHTLGVGCLAFSHDGRRALSGSDDMTIRLWALPDPPAG